MNKVAFNHEDIVITLYIDSLKEILEKETGTKYFISRNVSILENNKEISRTVLSIHNDIVGLDFMEQSFNVICTMNLKNGNKYSIMDEEINLKTIIIMKTLSQNEDLVKLDSIRYYDGKLPETIKVSQNRQISILLDETIIEDNQKLENLKNLLNYKPNKIINLCNERFFIKVYDGNKVRFKFDSCKEEFNILDNDFYENKKIRIKDENIFNFDGYIFCRTTTDNCIVLLQKNKAC